MKDAKEERTSANAGRFAFIKASMGANKISNNELIKDKNPCKNKPTIGHLSFL